MRLNRIEFRWGRLNKRFELVRLNEDGGGHYVIAFFKRTKDGYDMQTVGQRFFEDEDAWEVAKYAIAFLDAPVS